MIAAFKVLLPFEFNIPTGVAMVPLALTLADTSVRIDPPYQCELIPGEASGSVDQPAVGTLDKLGRRAEPTADEGIRVGGRPTIAANAISIVFQRAAFDRSRPPDSSPEKMDPPLATVFALLNRVLQHFRLILKAPFIHPMSPETSVWRIDYFNDDGSELKPDPSMVRGRLGRAFSIRFAILNGEVWGKFCQTIPSGDSPVWEDLYLDAVDALPGGGAAVVLAFSAVETIVALVLDHMAELKVVPADLWKWINNRNQYWREPSVADEVDTLMRVISGDSLRDDRSLWNQFSKLKKSRDTFVHTGVLEIDGQRPGAAELADLVLGTRAVLDWLSARLPEGLKPLPPVQVDNVEILRRLT